MADVLRLWDSLLSDRLSFTKQCHLGLFFQTTFSKVTWLDLILFFAATSNFGPLRLEIHR